MHTHVTLRLISVFKVVGEDVLVDFLLYLAHVGEFHLNLSPLFSENSKGRKRLHRHKSPALVASTGTALDTKTRTGTTMEITASAKIASQSPTERAVCTDTPQAQKERKARPESDFPTLECLVDAVANASGAAGKVEDERVRIACRFILQRFRDGGLGRVVLDHLPVPSTATTATSSVPAT